MCGKALAIASISPARHAQRRPDVADRVPDPVGVHHRDRDAPLAAVPVEDRLVDLQPPGGLHVDVDVGQGPAQRGEEPLHEQPVAQRVDAGHAEQVVDQAAGARPAGRGPDAHLADQVADVGDGEEVGRVAELADELELVVEPLPDALPGRVAVAAADPGLAPGPQHLVGGAAAPLAGARVVTASSGKCTSPSPRSARGSTAHRSATTRVCASSSPGRPLPEPGQRGRPPRRRRPSPCRT